MFKSILKETNHATPLLYLGGVSSVNLGFILDLDYIYYGEVNIFQEQLDSFLETAQKLGVKGLFSNFQDNQNPKSEETSPKKNFLNEDDFLCQQPEEKQIVKMNNTTSTRRQYQRSSFNDTTKINVGSMKGKLKAFMKRKMVCGAA